MVKFSPWRERERREGRAVCWRELKVLLAAQALVPMGSTNV